MPDGLSPRAETIRNYSTWFMIYGVVLILLGAFAITAPGIATLAVELMIGWLLLIGGIIGLVSVFTAGTSAPGFWWNLITAMVYVLAGIALLWSPISGAITLTLILAAYLLAAGVTKVVLSFGYRETIRGAWGWMLLSGLVDIVLGGLVILGLPLTGLWVLGLLVGINLVFTGVALVIAAVHARRPTSGESVPHRA